MSLIFDAVETVGEGTVQQGEPVTERHFVFFCSQALENLKARMAAATAQARECRAGPSFFVDLDDPAFASFEDGRPSKTFTDRARAADLSLSHPDGSWRSSVRAHGLTDEMVCDGPAFFLEDELLVIEDVPPREGNDNDEWRFELEGFIIDVSWAEDCEDLRSEPEPAPLAEFTPPPTPTIEPEVIRRNTRRRPASAPA